MPRPPLILLLLSTFLFAVSPAQAAPRVVVTIKPIHSLVANVMQGVAEPVLMIQGNHSPHTFTLKPSQMHQLENADIIFWVGESLETSLQKTLHNAAEKHQVVALSQAPGLVQLATRSDQRWEHKLAHNDEHEHDSALDPHIWLTPVNAARLVQYIAETLSQFDPQNAHSYNANASSTLARIHQLDEQIAQQLKPLQPYRFVVFHDAYQHFEHHYHLNAVAAVALSPDRLPGARHISEIKQRIKALKVSCIFNETQFNSNLVNSLQQDNRIKTGSLDPLGATLSAGSDAWFDLMQNISDSISDCLSSAIE